MSNIKSRQEKLEPNRRKTAIKEILKRGFTIIDESKTRVVFIFKEKPHYYYYYTGWATGKEIKDGRGLKNLLKQLDNLKQEKCQKEK